MIRRAALWNRSEAMDLIRSLIMPLFGVLACAIIFLISAVAAQELGRLFFGRAISRKESALGGLVVIAGIWLIFALVLYFVEASWPMRP
jgi:hypothetical protein